VLVTTKIENQRVLVSPKSSTSITVIVNAHSGSSDNEELLQRLESLFNSDGHSTQVFLAHSGMEVVELAQHAASSNAQIIVAGGGDGTVSTVAGAIAGTDKILGVLPMGTLNHFAKDLRIPLDIEEAVQTIMAGNVQKIDVGQVNEYFFINNSSLGLYPSIVREREKTQRLGIGKWPAFIWAAITVLRRYPFLDVKLSVDGEEIVSRAPFVFVGNNEYQMETFHVGARDCLDEGRLSLYTTRRVGRLGLIMLALYALIGRLTADKDFLSLCSEEILVTTKRKVLRVAMDGEVRTLVPPLRYRVNRLALRVLVPEKAPMKVEA
jgi:YegS/Rv2252/BmrU family lipid kinase